MTNEQLTHLKQLCEKATPGPWIDNEPDQSEPLIVNGVGIPVIKYLPGDGECEAFWMVKDCDIQFIAASRTALPALIEEVERLREENEQLKRDKDCMRYDMNERGERS